MKVHSISAILQTVLGHPLPYSGCIPPLSRDAGHNGVAAKIHLEPLFEIQYTTQLNFEILSARAILLVFEKIYSRLLISNCTRNYVITFTALHSVQLLLCISAIFFQ